MYAIVTSRRQNKDRAGETRARFAQEFKPLLQQAPGFVSFTLIDGEDGVTMAVVMFASKVDADAFREHATAWGQVLDDMGHHVESTRSGEVALSVTPSV